MSATKGAWPTVRIGEVLRLRAPDVSVEPTQSYQFAGVYCFGRGVFRGQEKQGAEFAYRKLTQVRAGEFVYPKLMAWEGAFGVVPAECDGCHVSPEFPVFEVNSERVLPRFLGLHFQRPAVWAAVSGGSTGTNMRRRRLNPADFLRREIPLPPLAEQKRITEYLDAIAARAARAAAATHESDADLETLLANLAHRPDLSDAEKHARGWKETTLSEVLRRYEDVHQVSGTAEYPNLGIYCFGKGVFAKPPIDGAATAAQVLYRVRAGQFIYSRLFAFERSYGVVPQSMDGWFVSGEFPVFDIDTERAVPAFLYAYFRPQAVWNRLLENSRGLGSRRVRIHPDVILAHRTSVPPMAEQNRISEIVRRVDALRAHHEAHCADLTALHFSLLDQAFKGEL
jgi:type I restriction enzyme, S subunit